MRLTGYSPRALEAIAQAYSQQPVAHALDRPLSPPRTLLRKRMAGCP
ncbi:hypothetical protein chiPu_0020585, partial [Chiloscyllium punctatum]|nr:hypothetical protein [Chiloscyllium punctatum]